MGKTDTSKCVRGCGQSETLLCTLWGCHRVRYYWDLVEGWLSKVTGEEITVKPVLADFAHIHTLVLQHGLHGG